MLHLEGGFQGLDRINRFSARVTTADKAILQKGGFVYVTYPASSTLESSNVLANAALATGTITSHNVLAAKLVYPIFISRPAPGDPRTDFLPLDESNLVTCLEGDFKAMATRYSYFQDGGTTHADIAAGDPLKIATVTATVMNNASWTGTTETDDRPMLVKATNGTYEEVVAYALSPEDGKRLRIRWCA